jgi:ferredoxin-NADP reductase
LYLVCVATLVLPTRDVVQATPRTRAITLDSRASDFSFTAGQAVFAGLAEGAQRRPYSIASSPTEARTRGILELLVQIDDHEPPDPHLERAVPGTLLRIEGPFGSFSLPSPLSEQHLLLIAGGTGIAPLRSMMRETLEKQPDVRIALIYSARGPDDFAYREELTELASRDRIELHLTTTRDAGAEWIGLRGRIDEGLTRAALKSTRTRCMVCGPPALVDHAIALLTAAGVARDQIGSEAASL